MRKPRRLIYTLAIIMMVAVLSLSLFACKQDEVKEDTGGEEVVSYEYENTILIYMCGSDLESRHAAATDNITEIVESGVPEGTAIVIETGGARHWRDYDISSSHIGRYEVVDDGIMLIEQLPNASMGSGETLSDFLDFGITNYRARNMGLIFWDHGGGGLDGVCFDENYNYDSLSISELDVALESAVASMGDKFNMIGFDACLMANIETADIVYKYADYMMASEENEPLGGWNYTNFATNFGSKEGYINILNNYRTKCEEDGENMYTLSLIDMAKYDSIHDSFRKLTTKLNSLESIKDAGLSAYFAMSFGSSIDEFGSNYVDLVDFAIGLSVYNMFEAAEDAITHVDSDTREGASGLSIFFPYSFTDEMVEEYISLPVDNEYKKFISDNFIGVSDNNIVFTDMGSDKDGEIHVAITEESKKYVRDVKYKIYRFVEDDNGVEHVYLLGYDSDVLADGGGYTTSFGGLWAKWNGHFISCSMVDRVDSITVFSTKVKLNGTSGEIVFVYDLSDQTFEVEGFVEENASISSSRIRMLRPDDKITLLYDDRTLGFHETLVEGSEFLFRDAPNLELGTLPAGYFQSYVIITDIFGKQYRTNSVVSYFDGTSMRIEIIGDADGDD